MFSVLLASILSFYHVQVPVAAMYETPAADTEVVSQALFAEAVKVLEKEGNWIKIQVAEDNSCGWIKEDAVCGRETAYADCTCVTPIVEVTRLAAHIYDRPSVAYAPLLTLSFESRLEAMDPFEDPESPWMAIHLPDGTLAYIQRGDVTSDIHAISKDQLVEFSKRFLNLPFTQAGRSSFGYDSAGFIQMLYKQIGSLLPSRLQEQYHSESLETISIDALEPGDLIFWGQSESEIHHVGMFIGDKQFIHTTTQEYQPWLRVSHLDMPFYQTEGQWTFCAGKRIK